jgi:hypothetical protein
LLLHFSDHQGGAMDRKDYGVKINNFLKEFNTQYDYKGEKIISRDFFNLLIAEVKKDRQGKVITRLDIACQRAEKIYNMHKDQKNTPGKAESSSTVFFLVIELMKYISK